MPIGGNADTFTITGAKLKVSGGVKSQEVSCIRPMQPVSAA